MKISIDKAVFASHDHFMVGCLSVSGVNISKASAEIPEMLRDIEEYVRLNFNEDAVQSHHLISAWKAAVAHYGEKFHHYQTNVEQLMKVVLTGGEIKSENKLVDLVHFFTLKFLVPMNVIDLKKVSGKLLFTLAEGGELVFKDDKHVLARKLNYELNSKVVVTDKTTDALVYIEALPPLNVQQLDNILQEAAGLVKAFCGGKVKRFILTKEKLSAEI